MEMWAWLSNLFMNSTADAAFEMALYSVDKASGFGMYQMKEPNNLKEFAAEYGASIN